MTFAAVGENRIEPLPQRLREFCRVVSTGLRMHDFAMNGILDPVDRSKINYSCSDQLRTKLKLPSGGRVGTQAEIIHRLVKLPGIFGKCSHVFPLRPLIRQPFEGQPCVRFCAWASV